MQAEPSAKQRRSLRRWFGIRRTMDAQYRASRGHGRLLRPETPADRRHGRNASMISAAEQWTQALAAWAIPPEILAAAPESPWGFPTEVSARRADTVPEQPTPSTQRALEALPAGRSVLAAGCGTCAGPPPARHIARDPIG